MHSKMLNFKFGRFALLSCSLLAGVTFVPTQSRALPWDVDMFSQQSLKPNEVSRSAVKGTVPMGKLENSRPTLATAEAATKLKNPVLFSQDSVWAGKHVWSSNCTTCHGESGQAEGPVAPLMGVPDLMLDLYKNRTDGYILGVFRNGGMNMPRYGYKLTVKEQGDVINYLRFLQGREVRGIKRPEKVANK